MLRKIFAVIIGCLGIFAVITLLTYTSRLSLPDWMGYILIVLPFLIGGMIAGYFVAQKGWLYGILAAACSVMFILIFDVLVNRPTISEIPQALPFLLVWFLFGAVFCAAGGYLGQLLAQIWHKK